MIDLDEPLVLAVTGMTCAACAARIEKKLNKIDGVSATVNYATSKATVTSSGVSAEVASLIKTIEDLGYGAVAPKVEDGESTTEIATEAHLVDVRRRLAVSTVCALPVMLMSMMRPLQFDGWQWVSLASRCQWRYGEPHHFIVRRGAMHDTEQRLWTLWFRLV